MDLAVVLSAVIGAGLGALVMAGATRSRPLSSAPVSASDVLRREIGRARRYERRFVLIRLDSKAVAVEGPSVLEVVTPLLRDLDYAWAERSGVHVLLPEVGRDEGLRCLARLRKAVEFDEDRVRMAVFPDDTVTEGGLMLHLDGASALPAPTDLPSTGARLVGVDSDEPRAS